MLQNHHLKLSQFVPSSEFEHLHILQTRACAQDQDSLAYQGKEYRHTTYNEIPTIQENRKIFGVCFNGSWILDEKGCLHTSQCI